jgi:hypothetical protein
MAKNILIDGCDCRKMTQKTSFGTDKVPSIIVEGYGLRSNQLLQCPSAGEPSALFEWELFKLVHQIYIAELGLLIPPEHGVNRFGELSAAGFVDAACIDPYILDVICEG